MESRSRLNEVDALRGFALLGIAVVNVPIFSEPWTGVPRVEHSLDILASFVTGTFFVGKFFVLFAFLFGWGMVHLDRTAISGGVDASKIWRRRMFALMGIGLAHGILVFSFDILMIYSVLGLLLSKASKWEVKRLGKHAMVAFLLAPFAYAGLAWWNQDMMSFYDPESMEKAGIWTYGIHLYYNLWGLPFCQGVNLLYNGATSYAAVCMGILAAKKGFFEAGSPLFAQLKNRVAVLWLVGIVLNLPNGILNAMDVDSGVWLNCLSMAMVGIGAPWLTAAYIVTVTEWARESGKARFLSAAGRMSMTAYVLEGVIAGWVFYEYGLGMNMEMGSAGTFATALGIFIATKMACSLWLRFNDKGPLEIIWRKIAYQGIR